MPAGARWEAAVLTAMILMSLADHHIAAAEVARIRWLFAKLAGLTGLATPSEQEVRETIEHVEAEGLHLDEYLEDVAPRLDDEGKRQMLMAAFVIATADGRVVAEEDALLVRIARCLDISPQTHRALLSHFNVARQVE